MRGRGLAKAACFVLLSSGPLLIAIPASGGDEPVAHGDDSSSRSPSFVATVLERTGASLTLKRESGEVEILSFDDPGLTVRIDRDVVKGARVRVTEEKTSMSRTLTVQVAPPN